MLAYYIVLSLAAVFGQSGVYSVSPPRYATLAPPPRVKLQIRNTTNNNVVIADLRFLLDGELILDHFLETRDNKWKTLSCKASAQENVKTSLRVAYSSRSNKYYKVVGNSVKFKSPQDLIVVCSYDKNTKYFTVQGMEKPAGGEGVSRTLSKVSKLSDIQVDLKVPQGGSPIFTKQIFKVSCKIEFKLPRQQEVLLISNSTNLNILKETVNYQMDGMKVIITVTQTIQSNESATREQLKCTGRDAAFLQIAKQVSKSVKFNSGLKSVEIFSNCLGTGHLCIAKKTTETPNPTVDWKIYDRTGALSSVYEGTQISIQNQTRAVKMCCTANVTIASAGVKYSKNICRKVMTTCAARTRNIGQTGPIDKTFTNQGRTGRYGKLQHQYVSIPGCYKLTVLGAAGGADKKSRSIRRCKGAKVVTTVKLRTGTNLTIVVGQMGSDANGGGSSGYGGGGGGGTFVYSGQTLYSAAGGAGGQESSTKSSCQGKSSTSGGRAYQGSRGGGTNGNGGGTNGEGGAGAGWLSSGSRVFGSRATSGKSRTGNWEGGKAHSYKSGAGGYGGGGGGHYDSGGGGGGYSGGAGSSSYAGGGGGSYCKGLNCTKFGSNNNGHGMVKIKGPLTGRNC